MLKKLVVIEGLQDIFECQKNIKELGDAIGKSDFSSTLVTSARILSMRILLDLLEDYNNQLIILRGEE